MYKIRSYISIFLSNKINYNKIYDIFNKINVKHNLKKSTTTIIYKLGSIRLPSISDLMEKNMRLDLLLI
jgi:hypothetical protein